MTSKRTETKPAHRPAAAEPAEAMLRALMQTTPLAVIVMDRHGHVTVWNQGAERMFGWTQEEVLGKPLPFVPAEKRAEGQALREATMRGEAFSDLELRRCKKNGEWIDVLLSNSPLRDETGTITGIVGVMTDITDRVEAESQLRLHGMALQAAANGVVITDRQGVVLWVNAAFTKLTGYRYEEVLGKRTNVLKSGHHSASFYDNLWSQISAGEIWQGEMVNRRKDGTLYTEEQTITPVRGATGEITHFISIKQDVTQRKLFEQVLRDSEEQYRSLVEAAQDVIFTLSPEGRITSLNSAFEAMTGWPRDAWLDEPFAPILAPASLPVATQMFARVMQGGPVPVFEAEVLTKDGCRLVAQISATPQVRDGKVIGVLGIARDTTANKQVELTLREGEERYRAVVEQSADGIYMVDAASQRVVESNAAFQQMLGYTKPEAGKLTLHDIVVDEAVNIAARLNELTRNRRPHTTERRYRRKDGSVLTVAVTASVITYSGRDLVCTIVRDITEQKRTEQALQESEELFRSLSACSPLGVFLTDVVGRCIYSNPQCRGIFGTSLMESLGEGWMRRLHPEDQERVRAEWLASVRDGRELTSEFRILGADAKVNWVYLRSARMISDKGEFRGNVATVENITERKQAEQVLRETNRQLEAVLAQLKATQAQVVQQERLSALGTMASGIAHDFNNALASILGFSELLLHRPGLLEDKEKTQRYLNLMNTAAKDAGTVVSRLREFYRHREEGEVFAPVDVNRLAEQAVGLTQPKWQAQAQASGITIKVVTDFGAAPAVAGNSAELREGLTNLIINAVDAMPAGGTVTVQTRAEDGQAVITIADTGTGMTDDVKRRCFEPFFSTKGTRGTGLGLSMVYGIITRHRGTVDIASEIGRGTTFTIRLPAATTDAAPNKVVAPAAVGRPLQLLLVDDEEMVRNVLADLLRSEGHSVDVAPDGVHGLEEFRRKNYDVAFVDRAMPGMSGDQVAQALKSVKPDLPVVLLTGFGSLMNSAGEKPAGVDFVLGKPATIADLRAALVRAVNIGNSGAAAVAAGTDSAC